MHTSQTAQPTVPNRHFLLFCLASFFLAMPYGATFLLTLLMQSRGGDEQDAGAIISAAIASTFAAVLGAGHVSDWLGAARSIVLAATLLIIAMLGFALAPGTGAALMVFGAVLGLGWGLFYTLGPIMVAAMVAPAQRGRFFALLSGSMMCGIGSGPLLGRLAAYLAAPVVGVFYLCALAGLGGALIYAWLSRQPHQQGTPGGARISWAASITVLRSRALWPIIMVGLGGALFAGLGSFQTSYAAARGLDYSLFFIGFTSAAIGCRLLLSGMVMRRDAYWSASVLCALTVLSIISFRFWVHDSFSYLLTAATLGVGYGLTYSVINGLVANEAPAPHTAQALLLFSLGYFVGVFGFPGLAGNIIVAWGMDTLLMVLAGLAICSWVIAVVRLGHREWRRVRVVEAR